MHPSLSSFPRSLHTLGLLVVAGVVLASCGPTANKPAVQASAYDRAKDAFKSGQLAQALDLTDKLATAGPPGSATDRARVLRTVICSGELKSAMELAAAYGKGADKTKDSGFGPEFRRLQNDNFEAASEDALNLAQTAHEIASGGVIGKDETLEASYPTAEGPTDMKLLAQVEHRDSLESDQQNSLAAGSLSKGIEDALADVVSGDRAKARTALATGSATIDGAAFAIFLGKELADGATVFDRHHSPDPQKLVIMWDEGEECLKAALALLKETPNKEQAAEVKKLREKYKNIRKDL